MTRINCVPVTELTDKHLIAEWKELPRVIKLSNKWFNEGCKQALPDSYRMGEGHVKFFYNKIAYLFDRYRLIRLEMIDRGFKPDMELYKNVCKAMLATNTHDQFNNWKPDERALQANRERIKERLGSEYKELPLPDKTIYDNPLQLGLLSKTDVVTELRKLKENLK